MQENLSTQPKPVIWQLKSFKILIGLLVCSALVYIASIVIPITNEYLPVALRNTGSPVFIRMSVIGLVSLLIVGWFAIFSPFSKTVRFAPLWLLLGFVISFFSVFKLAGFYGDMTPIVELREWCGGTPQLNLEEDFTSSEEIQNTNEVKLTDFPQFMGPNRNGKIPEIELLTDWKNNPPEKMWEIEIGGGWSGFAISGLRAVTQEQREEKEVVSCYHLLTGKLLWAHSNTTRYETGPGGNGPRATPTIAGNKVYAVGATGHFDCIELKTGKLVWSKDIVEENDATVEQWGKSSSPLVIDDKVIVGPGGKLSLIAYHKDTGKMIWKAGKEPISYASPIVATIAGVRQILAICESDLYGFDPDTGKTLLQVEWTGENSGNPNISQPVVLEDDRIFFSKGYGGGSKLVQITKDKDGKLQSEKIWASRRVMKTKFTNIAIHEGYVYGIDELAMQCIELKTGKRRWKKGRYNHGQLLMVGGLILQIHESSGELVLIRPNPKKLEELGRVKILTRKTWNNLAISGPYLLARNHKEAVCYKLPVKNQPPKDKSKKEKAELTVR